MNLSGEAAAATGGGAEIVPYMVVLAFWVAFFSWATVVGWAIQRRKERVAYYQQETERRLIDKGTMTADQVLRLRREDQRVQWLRRREGLRLGGLITAAAGIGILICLQFIDTGDTPAAAIACIPLTIGLVLLLYAYVLCPKSTEPDGGVRPPPPERQPDQQHY